MGWNGMVLSSDVVAVSNDKECLPILERIFSAIEGISLKPRNMQFKLKTKYIGMLQVLTRKATRLKWTQSEQAITEGKAALTEILEELEKINVWQI